MVDFNFSITLGFPYECGTYFYDRTKICKIALNPKQLDQAGKRLAFEKFILNTEAKLTKGKNVCVCLSLDGGGGQSLNIQ